MKIRNYLMYWANRLMEPGFKNEYYQANLKQFWEHTYEALCVSVGLSIIVSLFFFPWGTNVSEHHPLYNAGWFFAFAQFTISSIITFSSIIFFNRFIPDTDKIERSIWLFVLMFLSSLLIQHGLTKMLYHTIPWTMGASLFPLILFLSTVMAICKLPVQALDKIDTAKGKFLSGIAFLFMDPLSGSFRLTLFLEKVFGKRPGKPYCTINHLNSPKPKDYKIWGVKSNAEKELQKIFDE